MAYFSYSLLKKTGPCKRVSRHYYDYIEHDKNIQASQHKASYKKQPFVSPSIAAQIPVQTTASVPMPVPVPVQAAQPVIIYTLLNQL